MARNYDLGDIDMLDLSPWLFFDVDNVATTTIVMKEA